MTDVTLSWKQVLIGLVALACVIIVLMYLWDYMLPPHSVIPLNNTLANFKR